ncbi:FAD-dependent oxidoreductase [Arenibacter palladensis]|uniref:FAD-dependent oxidoreductase n=1 Tax=Arenibacter palladensis TaxID=237373 RepID=UPI0026E34493|nr:FAD-dependent oxidoreductase [Arenibacter palladensis]MDO6603953.1 FAD-dependent oxidoreductase [Arenibacter palladensis]
MNFMKSNSDLPTINEVDICVLGGSCTGVFAAVRAARLGAKVAIVEKQNAFGGVATNAMVNTWHSLRNTDFTKQIIAGLTSEVLERLAKRDAFVDSGRNPDDKKIYRSQELKNFNSQELKIELDELILESDIHPYLHTLFSEPFVDESGKLIGVIVDNKSGRGVIKGKYFIDATGDGDLCYRLGLDSYVTENLQPPTTCAYFDGWDSGRFQDLLKVHRDEFNIPEGYAWGAKIPTTNTYMLAGTRIYGVNCADAEDLTKAEIEGRRQIRAMLDMVRKYGDDFKMGLVSLPSTISIRETRHIKCQYQVTDEDALTGRVFEDAIANCSYRLDTHHQDKPGLTFKYLDGTEVYERPGHPKKVGRWREDTKQNPTFYQIPLRSLIPQKFDNLILAGRMLDASPISFSGIRVMVNMNQAGEAAGVTAFLALQKDISIREVAYQDVRKELANGGSIII